MTNYIDLSGKWNLAMFDGMDMNEVSVPPCFSDSMEIPGTTAISRKGKVNTKKEEGFLTEVYPFEGTIVVSRSFEINDDIANAELFLERTRMTRVWLNGNRVEDFNTEESLLAPHIYYISDYLKKGENVLTIMISNVGYPSSGGHLTSPDTCGNWIGIIGRAGIYLYPEIYAGEISLTPDISEDCSERKLDVFAHFNADISDEDITLSIYKMPTERAEAIRLIKELYKSKPFDIPESLLMLQTEIDTRKCVDGYYNTGINYTLDVSELSLWSEYDTSLYIFEMILGSGDVKREIFGLRDIRTKGRDILLNGNKIYLRGKHDGMLFPLTGVPPMDVAEWVNVFATAKEYGINHYRYHTSCPPEAAFMAADLMGIYMCPEVEFWGTVQRPDEEGYKEEKWSFLRKEADFILKCFGNHPSFTMMSLGNELWGSRSIINDELRHLKEIRKDKLYTEGANNFQFFPAALEEEDYFVAVRLGDGKLIRGSCAMCDAPLGFVQTEAPNNVHSYDDTINEVDRQKNSINDFENASENDSNSNDDEVLIQIGTGFKKVEAGSENGDSAEDEWKKKDDAACRKDFQLPLISHETGQYAAYPELSTEELYMGVMRADNLSLYRERLERAGIADIADKLSFASGKLMVQCYREELEALHASKEISGYQLLDLQDYPGQGGAYVGILNAFMNNKGYITPEGWRDFCNDKLVLARFKTYIYESKDKVDVSFILSYFDFSSRLEGALLDVKLSMDGEYLYEEKIQIPDGSYGVVELGERSVELPYVDEPHRIRLELSAANNNSNTSYYDDAVGDSFADNLYELYIFPANEELKDKNEVLKCFEENDIAVVTTPLTSAEELNENVKEGLREHSAALYIPERIDDVLKVTASYVTDFWCYPMFRSISEGMNRPVPVGTLGLLNDNSHPVFKGFPTDDYSTPVWYNIIEGADTLILDGDRETEVISRCIDNIERSHSLGVLMAFEEDGKKCIVCTPDILSKLEHPEVRSFVKRLIEYLK